MNTLRQDSLAGIVVFLVALPLRRQRPRRRTGHHRRRRH